MKELLEYILQSILTDYSSVSIEEEEESPEVTVFRIRADENQKGAIIGRGGRTIKSIRNILSIKAIKEGKKVFVKVE